MRLSTPKSSGIIYLNARDCNFDVKHMASLYLLFVCYLFRSPRGYILGCTLIVPAYAMPSETSDNYPPPKPGEVI